MKLKSMTIQITSLCFCYISRANGVPATPSRDEFATIEEEKDLKEDSANFTIAMSHWTRAILYTDSNRYFTFLIWKLISN